MKRPGIGQGMVAVAVMMVMPQIASAQPVDTAWTMRPPIDPEESVIQYDLTGPRIGLTIAPDGTSRSQFGWHSEHQAAPGSRGPWFIVETIFLFGGVEHQRLSPSGTVVFGIRLPNGYEFGLGPGFSLSHRGLHSSLVLAAGRSFRAGGIRIPVNVALAADRDGQRLSFVTGWAIRDRNPR